MKKKLFPGLIFVWILFLVFANSTLAQSQDGELKLRLNKIFGYSSLSNREFQGTMRLSASGPEDLVRVVFHIDGQVMGEASQSPFRISFNTESYSLGTHTISAIGYTTDGRELSSNELRVNFVSSAAGMQTAMKILIPVLVVVLASILLGLVFPTLGGRGKRSDLPLGAPRNYGISGGAICPQCGRPFAMHWTGINISPVHKLDRCPYCGKWGLMRRRSQVELRAAEAAELRQAQQSGEVPTLSEEDKLRRELENSRYQDI